ncbi:hypothetical protein D1BOALGB6SA_8993 [Olavius sp. associated proteobacterium Delta 1]|nr:hypothetical protein D1BOALGB6SA_8993 [Olavius sp. associated proteobacterium Delta 1]
MKDLRYLILWVTIASALLYCIGGCSGGGGNGGDDGIAYSGLTSQAEISDQNAEDISGGSFGAGLIGDGMMGFSLDQSSNEKFVRKFRTVKVPEILSDSLHLIDFTNPPAGVGQAALETVSETIDGNCGGSMSYSVSADNVIGTFSGRFTFSQYCNDGTTINGRASFEGRINLDTEEFVEAYLSFDNLSGGGLTLDGDIEFDFASSPNMISFNAYAQDPGTGKVYWIRDYSIAIGEYVGLVQIEMSGMFYHPDYGYVNLSTTAPFILHDGDEWPTSGTLVVTGVNNSKAKITAIDNANCAVEADFDGDDSYEWDSGTIIWDDI